MQRHLLAGTDAAALPDILTAVQLSAPRLQQHSFNQALGNRQAFSASAETAVAERSAAAATQRPFRNRMNSTWDNGVAI